MSTDQQWDIVTGVGLTALAVAAGRAIESARPDALMTDPYASRLVAAAQPPVTIPYSKDDPDGAKAQEELWSATSQYMGLRSRVFDDYFMEAAAEGVTQVVILAAGLDTRPFRLKWPAGTVCFELDQPAVLDFKLRTLKEEGAEPACDHRPVPIDLRDDWATALTEAGFDTSRPTAWLAEGLLPYLPPEAESSLFQTVSRLSASGSRFAVEQVDGVDDAVNDPLMRDVGGKLGVDLPALFPSGEREPVNDQLSALGWQLRHAKVSEMAASHGRVLDDAPLFTMHMVHSFGRLA